MQVEREAFGFVAVVPTWLAPQHGIVQGSKSRRKGPTAASQPRTTCENHLGAWFTVADKGSYQPSLPECLDFNYFFGKTILVANNKFRPCLSRK